MKFSRRGTSGLFLPTQGREDYSYVDHFNRSDESNMNGNLGPYLSTTSTQKYWIGYMGAATPKALQVVSNQIQFEASITGPRALWISDNSTTDSFFLTDQYARVTYKSHILTNASPLFAAYAKIGVCLRCQGGGSGPGRGYFGYINTWSGGPPNAHIGAFGPDHLGDIVADSDISTTCSALVAGDVIELRVTGFHPTTLSLYLNNVLLLTTSTIDGGGIDGTANCFSSGAPGVFWGGGSDGNGGSITYTKTFGDDWIGGPLAYPASNFNEHRGSGYWFPPLP